MAFWRNLNFGFRASTSRIDGILARPGFSLSDLLDEEDLLQECRATNKKLLE